MFTNKIDTSQPKHFRGAAMVEFAIIMPVLLLLGLGVTQSALFYQAKTTVTYATFEAARKGATTHAQKEAMKKELGIRLAPIFGGDGSDTDILKAIIKGKTDALNKAITTIEILNPTEEAFNLFGFNSSKLAS